MSMGLDRKIRIFIGGLIVAALMLMIIPSIVYASGTTKAEANADASAVTGDQILSTNTKGYAVSGGDMDIDDCLSTFSYLFGLAQDVKTNPLCFAAQLDSIGKHKEAAQMRCSVRSIRKVFGATCVADLTAQVAPPPPPEDEVTESDDGEEERIHSEYELKYQAQQVEIEYVQEQLAEVVQQQHQQQARQARARPVQQQVQQQYLDASQIADLEELFGYELGKK